MHACLKASPARGACCDGYEWMERVGKACMVAGRSNAETKGAKEECACGVPAARVLNGALGESLVELRDLGHALFDYSGNVFVCTARRGGRVGCAGKGKAERGEEVNVLL